MIVPVDAPKFLAATSWDDRTFLCMEVMQPLVSAFNWNGYKLGVFQHAYLKHPWFTVSEIEAHKLLVSLFQICLESTFSSQLGLSIELLTIYGIY